MKFDAPLASRLATASDADQINVIITLASREDIAAFVRQTGIKFDHAYENIPAVAASLSAAKLREVAALAQVTHIELDSEAKALRKPGSN